MNIEYMSSEDDTDLAALIIKIGYRKRSKYFDIPNYLNKIYDNWGYQTHNDVISILELDRMEYPRRAPSYEYYWNNDAWLNKFFTFKILKKMKVFLFQRQDRNLNPKLTHIEKVLRKKSSQSHRPNYHFRGPLSNHWQFYCRYQQDCSFPSEKYTKIDYH
jgi:hypothetical protein